MKFNTTKQQLANMTVGKIIDNGFWFISGKYKNGTFSLHCGK